MLNTGITDLIQVQRLIELEKSNPNRYSRISSDLLKIKDFYLVERRNKMIKNLLKN